MLGFAFTRELAHLPGRLTVRFSLRPSVCLRPFTPIPRGMAAAVLCYRALGLTQVWLLS